MKLTADQKKLYKLIDAKNHKEINQLSNKIQEKNFFNEDGATPIHYAIEAEDLVASEILLKNSFPTEAIEGSASAILGALDNSNTEALELLVKYGADVNKPLQTSAKTYPISYAIYVQDILFSKKLIELGANLEAYSTVEYEGTVTEFHKDEIPVVFVAAQSGNIDIFELVLDSSKTFISKKGVSLFWVLLTPDERELDQFQNRAIKLMLEKKVPLKNALTQRIKLNQNQIIEDNAFCLMFKKNLDPREKRQREKIILQVLSDGLMETSWKKSDNTDLLELASSMGSERLVRYFLEKGLKILPKKNHYSALHRAACLRDSSLSYRIMNMLLEHMREDSAEVLDNLTEAGESAFKLACIYNNYDGALLLLENGAEMVDSVKDRDDEDIPLWVQLLCHIQHQEDVERLMLFLDHGLNTFAFKSKNHNCELNMVSVLGARILLQNKFQEFSNGFHWKGFYDEDNGYPKVSLMPLYKKLLKLSSAPTKIGKSLLDIKEIDKLIMRGK